MRLNVRGQRIVIGLLLVVITLATFGRVVRRHDFVDFDDGTYVMANPKVLHGLTTGGLAWAFTTYHANNWHPLTWVSLMLDAAIFGETAAGFHLTNLLLHLANVLLLFILLSRVTGSIWRSGFVSALFAVHPLHVESVAWIAERKDVLSTLFWMLTMLAYVWYVEFKVQGSRFKVGAYVLTVIFFALGLMAKPMLVTLPFVLLLLDYWPLGRFRGGPHPNPLPFRSWSHGRERGHGPPLPCIRATGEGWGEGSGLRVTRYSLLVTEKIPLLVLSAASSIMTFIAQGSAVSGLDSFPLGIRVANAAVAYVGYVGKMFWPTRLSPFYAHPGAGLPVWQVVGSALILIAVTILVFRRAREHPYLPFGWLWYLGTLVPVIGIVQVGAQAMADRYTYVPLIGVFVMIVWGIPELLKGRKGEWANGGAGETGSPVRPFTLSPFLPLSAAIALLALAACTYFQAGYWRNSLTLFPHALKIAPDNYLAHNNLGIALEKQGRLDEAVVHYTRALELRPGHAQAYNNLGNIFLRQGKLDEAIEQYREALRYKPDDTIINNNLGFALARKGRGRQAMERYQEALKANPDNAKAHLNLGSALLRRGRLKEAITHLSTAVELQPTLVRAHLNLGVALQLAGKPEEAMKHFEEAVKLDPRSADAHLNLGVALFRKDDIDEASRQFALALEVRPSDPDAHKYLAVAMYRKGRYSDAWSEVEMSRKFGGNPDARFIEALSQKMPPP